jgi:hypothetical protein
MKEVIIMAIRAIQYVDGYVKYDEIYEGIEYETLRGEMEELIGEAIDSYELEIIK